MSKNERETALQQQEREIRLESYIREYKIKHFGERYATAALSKLQIPEREAIKILNYTEKPKNMLVFCGSPGIGKTYFCAALTDWTIRNFETRRYHKEEHVLRRLRDGISTGNGDYLIALELLIDDQVIILDDVGSGINPSKFTSRDLEFRREVLYSFLDYRYNKMLPTIITSNFNKKEFLEVFSERISSRLFAKENTIIEIFGDGLDLREEGL